MDCLFQLCACTILIANQLSVSTDRKSLMQKCVTVSSHVPLLRSIISVSMVILWNGEYNRGRIVTVYYLNKNNLGEHKNPNAWNARNSAVQSNKENHGIRTLI